MIKTHVKDVEINMTENLYSWYNKEGGKEVGPNSVWHWHPIVSKELDSFIAMCKNYQYKSFIDVGAHCGIFSFAYSFLVRDHKCYSIEPIKTHTDKIQEVSSINGFNIETFNMALNNYIGSNKYYGDHMANFIDEEFKKQPLNFSEQTEVFNVRIDTMDNFIEQNKIIPQLIKLDVEGYEVPILEKAVNTLSEYPCHIFMETHRDECVNLGWKIEDICKYITEDKYYLLTYDLSYEIKNLRSYILDGESNTRFVAMDRRSIQ